MDLPFDTFQQKVLRKQFQLWKDNFNRCDSSQTLIPLYPLNLYTKRPTHPIELYDILCRTLIHNQDADEYTRLRPPTMVMMLVFNPNDLIHLYNIFLEEPYDTAGAKFLKFLNSKQVTFEKQENQWTNFPPLDITLSLLQTNRVECEKLLKPPTCHILDLVEQRYPVHVSKFQLLTTKPQLKQYLKEFPKECEYLTWQDACFFGLTHQEYDNLLGWLELEDEQPEQDIPTQDEPTILDPPNQDEFNHMDETPPTPVTPDALNSVTRRSLATLVPPIL